MSLTATPKRLQPRARHFPPERLKRREIPWYSVIVEVALHHRSQPFPGLGNPLVPPLAQLLPYRLQFAPQPLLDRLPSDLEPVALRGLPANMRESKKIEGLGFALSSPLPRLKRFCLTMRARC